MGQTSKDCGKGHTPVFLWRPTTAGRSARALGGSVQRPLVRGGNRPRRDWNLRRSWPWGGQGAEPLTFRVPTLLPTLLPVARRATPPGTARARLLSTAMYAEDRYGRKKVRYRVRGRQHQGTPRAVRSAHQRAHELRYLRETPGNVVQPCGQGVLLPLFPRSLLDSLSKRPG